MFDATLREAVMRHAADGPALPACSGGGRRRSSVAVATFQSDAHAQPAPSVEGCAGSGCPPLGWQPFAPTKRNATFRDGGPRLYTAVVDTDGPDRDRRAFCAIVAEGEECVRRRLTARFGECGSRAELAMGVDVADPRVRELVAPATLSLLTCVAADPEGDMANGFDLTVERRLA